jgi:uncharacterized protein
MDMTQYNPAVLLARAARLKLFVMLRRVVRPEFLTENLGEHLRWLIDQETAGIIFLSGPVVARDDGVALAGITIIRAPTIDEAEAIARQDPFIKLGIFTFDMHEWTVNEGGISLFVSLSDSSVAFR